MKNYLLKLLKFIEVDRAVSFAILGKFWRLAVAPITLIFIASFLTAEIQGYYYTFYSLIALQTFVELGFFIVITQFASHEWSKLKLNNEGIIEGDSVALSRLVSLGRLVAKWYFFTSLIFIVVVGIVGFVFFSTNSN